MEGSAEAYELSHAIEKRQEDSEKRKSSDGIDGDKPSSDEGAAKPTAKGRACSNVVMTRRTDFHVSVVLGSKRAIHL